MRLSPPKWDRDLKTEEVFRLPRHIAAMRIDTSLERKVSLLEKWAELGCEPGVNVKKLAGKRSSLRRWHDPQKKIWRWTVDVPDKLDGRNELLMARWSEAIQKIAEQGTDKNAELPRFTSMGARTDLERAERRVEALELQVLEKIQQIGRLEEQVFRLLKKGQAE